MKLLSSLALAVFALVAVAVPAGAAESVGKKGVRKAKAAARAASAAK